VYLFAVKIPQNSTVNYALTSEDIRITKC